jgi:hypothetical protein
MDESRLGRHKDFEANAMLIWQAMEIELETVSSRRKAAGLVAEKLKRAGLGWSVDEEWVRKLHRRFGRKLERDAELRSYALATLELVKAEHAKHPGTELVPARIVWLNKPEYGFRARRHAKGMKGRIVIGPKSD